MSYRPQQPPETEGNLAHKDTLMLVGVHFQSMALFEEAQVQQSVLKEQSTSNLN